MIKALGTALDWFRRPCCPNIMLSHATESDFVCITESGYLWEFEIKITKADWKADALKSRSYNPGNSPARFYYAVPESLCVDGIPEWVDPTAGVVTFENWEIKRGDDYPHTMRWLRQAKVRHKNKAPPALKAELCRKVYARYWRYVSPKQAVEAPRLIEVNP